MPLLFLLKIMPRITTSGAKGIMFMKNMICSIVCKITQEAELQKILKPKGMQLSI